MLVALLKNLHPNSKCIDSLPFTKIPFQKRCTMRKARTQNVTLLRLHFYGGLLWNNAPLLATVFCETHPIGASAFLLFKIKKYTIHPHRRIALMNFRKLLRSERILLAIYTDRKLKFHSPETPWNTSLLNKELRPELTKGSTPSEAHHKVKCKSLTLCLTPP